MKMLIEIDDDVRQEVMWHGLDLLPNSEASLISAIRNGVCISNGVSNEKAFELIYGEEFSGDEYIIKCNGSADDCDNGCKYSGYYMCNRMKWAGETFTAKGSHGKFEKVNDET